MNRIKRFLRILWCPTGFYLDTGKPIRLTVRQAWWISKVCGCP